MSTRWNTVLSFFLIQAMGLFACGEEPETVPFLEGEDSEDGNDQDSQSDDVDQNSDDVTGQDDDDDDDQDDESDSDTTEPDEDVHSYIWIANSVDGTLSKVDTVLAEEVARYWTSPQKGKGDPSRTSVNMHGDMVVTNRQPKTGPASVTKFATDKSDCIDRNNNGSIDTSAGSNNVLDWGEDECMLWNTPLPGATGMNMGARATAWDGQEDPDTGKGGHVFIGTTGDVSNMSLQGPKKVFKLDGDSGDIIGSKTIPAGAYGGAVDGKKEDGTFWIVATGCPMRLMPSPMPTPGMNCILIRVNMDTLESTTVNNTCGYGISIDAKGRVWTAGSDCVQRYDPEADVFKKVKIVGSARGVAVDGKGSVWVAMSGGDVIRIDEEQVTVIERFAVGQGLSASPIGNSLVGMAVDYEGYIWAVSQGENAAHKIDPQTYQSAKVPVGRGPYTYSDMTGWQLKQVVDPVVK